MISTTLKIKQAPNGLGIELNLPPGEYCDTEVRMQQVREGFPLRCH